MRIALETMEFSVMTEIQITISTAGLHGLILLQLDFSARLSPGGFIFDVAGSSSFPEDIDLVLGIMNSNFAQLCS